MFKIHTIQLNFSLNGVILDFFAGLNDAVMQQNNLIFKIGEENRVPTSFKLQISLGLSYKP